MAVQKIIGKQGIRGETEEKKASKEGEIELKEEENSIAS